MEVIPLDDRVRSTTVLNSEASSSDSPDFNATVFPDDAAASSNFDDSAATFDDEELAPAGGGLWTRKNKLLLSLVAGSALLCAAATGGGIAAHRARVNGAANRCYDNIVQPPEYAMPSGAKSSKSPSTKSSKSPSAKSSKAPATTTATPQRRLTVAATVEDDEEDILRKAGLTAHYPVIPKTVEDRRKNRMLAQQLGQPDVAAAADNNVSWMRRLQSGSPAAAKSSKSPSTKSSKAPGTPSVAKAAKSSLTAELIDCKCVNPINGGGAYYSSPGSKSSKSPSTKSSKSPSTKSSKSPSAKSSKSPSTKSSKSPSSSLTEGLRPTDHPITCLVPNPVNPRPPAPITGGGSQSSKSSKPTPTPPSPPPPPVNPVPEPVTPRPTPRPVVPPPAPEPVTPNCDNNEDWVTVNGNTCATIATAADPTSSLCALEDSNGLSASEACPEVCNEECAVNCDNNEGWVSTADHTCVDAAEYPDIVCKEVDNDGVLGVDACPASCNEECIVEVNCDNEEGWISTEGHDCADVASDPKMLCMEVNIAGKSASEACPASCNVECFEPVVPAPVPVPATPMPTEEPQIATPMPTMLGTGVVTSDTTGGSTVTVSTETTGPPTLANRDELKR